MRILADENMPIARDLFAKHGQFDTFVGRDLTASLAQTADILLVRSVTKVDEQLLGEHKPRFVGTATIGVDHLDQRFLTKQGIAYASAPGCNANSVAQYVVSSLYALRPNFSGYTAGVVAQGNVGQRVAKQLRALGLSVRVYDPHKTGLAGQVSAVEQLQGVNLLCQHAPMITEGSHPTQNLINQQLLSSLAPNALVISAGRGGVIDEQALKVVAKQRPDIDWAIDVWAGEPAIDQSLLPLATIATPHIAGHSVEGKRMGTFMLYQQVSQLLGWPALPINLGIEQRVIDWPGSIQQLVLEVYNPQDDDARMRLAMQQRNASQQFDQLRKQYPKRYEYSAVRVRQAPMAMHPQLTALGFEVSDV